MAYSDFLYDNQAVRDFGEYWVLLYLTNPSGAEEVVRLSRRGTNSPTSAVVVAGDTIAANLPFAKRVLRAPEITHSLWRPGSIGGSTFPSFGPMILNNRDGGLDAYKPSNGYKWHDRRCVVYFFDQRDPAGTGGKIFDGRMAQPNYSLVSVQVNLRGNEARFQVPLGERRYRGANYMLELSGVRDVDYGTGAVAAAVAAAGHTGSMTVEGWFWLDSWAATDRLAWGWSGQSPWGLVFSSARVLKLRVYVGGVSTDITSTITIPLTTPCHIAFVISGRDVTFYLWNEDAQTLTTDVHVNAISSATRDAPASGALYRKFGVASQVVWHDEDRVWNVARTADELADNRYAPLATIPSSCTHYLKMNDGTGTTATDSSASAANGTINGAGTSTWLWAMEGAAELAKTPKPDFWGQQPALPGILVDPIGANGPSGPTYQIAGAGALTSIAPREGANAITVSSNAASYRAFIVSAPAAGQAITYLARGLVKFGSQPTLPVSFDCVGYAGVTTAPTITRHIVTTRGPKLADPADLDTTAFTDYENAVNGAVMGLYVADPTQARALAEALDYCARSAGLGYWGYDRGNILFTVGRFTGPAVDSDYDYAKQHIARGSLKEHDIEAVLWKVVVRFQPRIVALSEDQVAAAVKGTAGWQVHTQAWQEADVGVQALRDAYPNDASAPLIVETGVYTRAAAQALAQSIADVVLGLKQGWDVTVPAIGQAIVAGDTVTLELTNQFGVQRLDLDGLTRLSVLTSKDAPQRGEVALQLWGSVV